MSRHYARESAMKAVYEYGFIKERNKITISKLSADENMEKEDIEYLNLVYEGVTANYDELTAVIEKLSEGFKLERLYKTDLALLLVALYEIKYLDDIPPMVSVNEAVELSKQYSTTKSASFINGILAAYIKGDKNECEDN